MTAPIDNNSLDTSAPRITASEHTSSGDAFGSVRFSKKTGWSGSAGHDSGPQEGATHANGEGGDEHEDGELVFSMNDEYNEALRKVKDELETFGTSDEHSYVGYIINTKRGKFRLERQGDNWTLDYVIAPGVYDCNITASKRFVGNVDYNTIHKWYSSEIFHYLAKMDMEEAKAKTLRTAQAKRITRNARR